MSGKKACGVVLEDGTEVEAKVVLSNASPKITYFDLLPKVRIDYCENVSLGVVLGKPRGVGVSWHIFYLCREVFLRS